MIQCGKTPHTCTHAHANTYKHIHVRTFFFSGSDDPYTYVCEFFHRGVHCASPPRQQGRSGGTQDGMSVKAWEREETSWVCSHRPESWLRALNKDLRTGARHLGGRSRPVRERMNTNTYNDTQTRTQHTSLTLKAEKERMTLLQ